MEIKLKLDLESAFLVFFFALLLWTASANVYEHRLSHERPIGYFASDAYQNYGIAAGINEQGNYRYQPIAVAGGYKEVIGHHPPILYILPGIFSSVSGLPIYDSMLFLIFAFYSLAPLGIYFIIRKYNVNAAILSLPFTLLIFTGKFYSAFSWGQWGFLTGSFFGVFVAWAATRFELRKGYVLLALFLAMAFYGHAAGFIFSAAFVMAYAGLLLAYNRFSRETIRTILKNLLIAGAVFLAISIYYFIIFQNTWARSQPFSFEAVTVEEILEGRPFPAVVERDFGPVLLILIGVGIVIGLLKLLKRLEAGVITGLFFSALGYSNMIGFGSRAFQLRFIWPLYLAVFFGLALFYPLSLVLKKLSKLHSIPIAVIAAIILLFAYYSPVSGAMVDQQHWDGMRWVKDNSEKDSKVLFLFQDFMSQTAVYYATQRETYLIELNDYIKAINEARIKRSYVTARNAEHSTALPYRKGAFSFGYHKEEERLFRERDICSFDYYVVDRVSLTQPELASYNLLLLNEFANNGMQVVYGNQVLTILRNDNVGGECINERAV